VGLPEVWVGENVGRGADGFDVRAELDIAV
jgi:hypothetical protein